MAIPTYLQGNVRYKLDISVTDVQTIIDNVTSEAIALSPAWTNPSAGKIISPEDTDGRKMTIEFSRISATNLQAVFTDGQGRTSTRRAQIAGGGSNINYYIGQYHMVLDWLNSTTPEGMYAMILDLSPELQTAHNKWMVVNTSRTSADSNDSMWTTDSCVTVRSSDVFATLASKNFSPIGGYQNGGGSGAGGCLRTIGGSTIWTPILHFADTSSGSYRYRGRFYQCLYTQSEYIGTGLEITVPIDEITTGTFKTLNMAPTSAHPLRFCVRKS
jgi:hypothetical protein